MRYTKCSLSTIFLLVISGCATSSIDLDKDEASEHLPDFASSQIIKKPSTFIEQTGPSISIKPLSREEQEIQEKDLLTSSIRKIDPTQPVAPALPKQHWKIQTGERLSDVFIRWAKTTNKWQLVWEAPDLVAQVDVDLEGEFENSVSKIIDALNRNDAGLQAKFYAANRVLRIMEKK